MTSTPNLGGRPVGTPNKSSQRQRELFAPHVQAALDCMLEVIRRYKGDSDDQDLVSKLYDRPTASEAIAASKVVCEYGLGKPTQAIEGSGEEGEHVVLVKYV